MIVRYIPVVAALAAGVCGIVFTRQLWSLFERLSLRKYFWVLIAVFAIGFVANGTGYEVIATTVSAAFASLAVGVLIGKWFAKYRRR
jgi:hypothetical protein